MWCLRRGNESEEESNDGCGKAPARCVFVAATARRPACGPDSVIPLCQMMYDVATALRRQVSHGGGLLSAVLSVPLVSLSTWGHGSMATSDDEKGCLPLWLCFFSASVALCIVRVDVPIRPDCVVSFETCGVACVNVPIRPV